MDAAVAALETLPFVVNGLWITVSGCNVGGLLPLEWRGMVPRQESPMAKKSSGGSYRSAITGRYVTAKHGKASPNTTVKEKR
jgi:hypothetical protein